MIELYHGDCLEIMTTISDKSIDMILCDLPYGTTDCKWDAIIPFEPLWKEYKRIIKDRGCIALFGSEPFSSHLRMSNIKQFQYDWIWNKNKSGNPFNAKYRPHLIFELISIFGNGKINYYPIMEAAKKENIRPLNISKHKTDFLNGFKSGLFQHSENYNPNLRYPKNELNFKNSQKECNPLNRIHPTQKPVPLLEYLIKTYTLEGETVLDNCMGSGSTGVACINTNRKFIGIEKDETYFEIARKRIEAEQNKNMIICDKQNNPIVKKKKLF